MTVLVAASDKAELESFGEHYECVVTGVGPVLAAASVSAAIARIHPDIVVSTGTAGSCGALAVGEIVSFGSAVFPDADLTAYGLEKGTTLLDGRKRLSSLPLDPSSSLVLVTSSAFASAPSVYGDACDMEAYGVAAAAFLHSVPCLAVKAITDVAGEPVGMKDYLRLRRSLVSRLQEHVEKALRTFF